ncbi:hypothetical protein [Planobispora takensis]|uniref:Uncharacterized protein n=1 Tax=Planobispora takensis TaxID=1367882 RepID=A0A8J3T4R2_9ACTN|nr:hypothetical protein [Planobispora takensis]GII05683.1 hypothetical protein Pta02_76910 [Planobispora takensis]
MLVASPPVLLLALVLAGPALWHAFVLEDLDVASALIRYLVAVAVSALMFGLLRRVTASYGSQEEDDPTVVTVSVDRVPSMGGRRVSDPSPGPGASGASGTPAGELMGAESVTPAAALPPGAAS